MRINVKRENRRNSTMMLVLKCSILVVLFIFYSASASELRISEDSKLFIRMNIKINSLMHTKIFAYAIGFRINFDLRKSSKKPKMLNDRGLVSAHFHPKQIQETVLFLFNSYGWNGTACLARTLCEISDMPYLAGDIYAPVLNIFFHGSKKMQPKETSHCHDASHCPISILNLLFPF